MKNEKIKELIQQLITKYDSTDIKVNWDGGNDEGCYYLHIKDNEIDIPYGKRESPESMFIQEIADIIGYGSFAGDFSCNGELSYDAEKDCLVGEDSYEESKDFVYKFPKPINITIPKDIWFDSLAIEASGYVEEIDVAVRLLISNGPVSQEHLDLEDEIAGMIRTTIDKTLCNDVYEVNNIWLDEDIKVEDMNKDEDGNPYFNITEISYSKYEGEDKDVYIQF